MQSLWSRLALVVFGLASAGLCMVLVLLMFPALRAELLGGQRFVFRESDGDAFHHQPGFVRPPAEDRVLEDFYIFWDENGFRRPRRVADHYPIVALGDSFTEGGEVPWVDVLAEALNIPVQNLGWRGFGTLQELEIMRNFVSPDVDWVLLAYFEGNDLSNIHSAYDEWIANAYISFERQIAPEQVVEIIPSEDGNYLYPLEHRIDEHVFELAYISDYIWWLNGERDVYERSKNVALLRDALVQMKSLAGEACVALIYIPVKAHVYLGYADPDGNRSFVLQNSLALSLDGEGWLGFGQLMPIEYHHLEARMDNQRNVVQALTAETGVLFFDLLPHFQAASFPPLYYTYDSHWSQAGHRLAGKVIAEYMQQADCG